MRMTNINKRKIEQIIDFDVLEEILGYTFQENIVRIRRNPNSPTKRSLMDISFFSPDATIISEIDNKKGIRRKEILLKLRKAFYKTYYYLIKSKNGLFNFGDVVNSYMHHVSIDKLQSSLASLNNYKKKQTEELHFMNYMIQYAIMLMNVGEKFMQENPELCLEKIISKRITEIIKTKNNLSEVELVLKNNRNSIKQISHSKFFIQKIERKSRNSKALLILPQKLHLEQEDTSSDSTSHIPVVNTRLNTKISLGKVKTNF